MEKRYTRRDFIRDTSFSSVGLLGLGAFIQSCAGKEIAYSTDLARAYIDGITGIISNIRDGEMEKIKQAAGYAVQVKLKGKKLYANLNGGMIQHEMDAERPGNPNLFLIEDPKNASGLDFVITNEPYSVRGLPERMVTVVGISSPSVLNSETAAGALENMGTLRIEDVADLVIYCHVPAADGIINVEGIDVPLFATSGIIHTLIYYSFVSEVMGELAKRGIYS